MCASAWAIAPYRRPGHGGSRMPLRSPSSVHHIPLSCFICSFFWARVIWLYLPQLCAFLGCSAHCCPWNHGRLPDNSTFFFLVAISGATLYRVSSASGLAAVVYVRFPHTAGRRSLYSAACPINSSSSAHSFRVPPLCGVCTFSCSGGLVSLGVCCICASFMVGSRPSPPKGTCVSPIVERVSCGFLWFLLRHCSMRGAAQTAARFRLFAPDAFVARGLLHIALHWVDLGAHPVRP